MKIVARVEKEPGEKNFSCYMNVPSARASVLGTGSSAKAAMADMQKGWEETVDYMKEEGKKVPELEIEYKFDIGSLFDYYDFINVSAISRTIGVSPTVMRQYVIGKRKPSEERKRKIMEGFRELASKMQAAMIY
ncbi:MAG: hypothetical protein ACOYJG_10910 [Prevotella sp.]|jgi:hypothetical protein